MVACADDTSTKTPHYGALIIVIVDPSNSILRLLSRSHFPSRKDSSRVFETGQTGQTSRTDKQDCLKSEDSQGWYGCSIVSSS